MHAAPMYIAETAPTPIRGQLISLKEFFIVLGMVVSSSVLELFYRTLNFLVWSMSRISEYNILNISFYYFITLSDMIFYQITFSSEYPGITKSDYISFCRQDMELEACL